MKEKIYYWGPFLDNVATVKAIVNSAKSINEYSSEYSATLIDVSGEWMYFKENYNEKNLNFRALNKNYYKSLPRFSFLKSRFSYLIIFIRSFFPLKRLLKKDNPKFLIIHLIVSLPMVLYLIFNFKTKLCLRISGKPKLNFFRKFLWKVSSKNIHHVFCPTVETKEELINKNIFKRNIFVLEDPIIEPRKIALLKKEKLEPEFKKNNIILIGRHTKQKNFKLFIEAFLEIEKDYPDILVYIFGEGELKKNLEKMIKKNKLEKKVFLMNYKKNIFKYLYNSKYFVLSSLWEDPGFVLIEAAFCNTSIISSNCPSGPKEFLKNGSGGFLFENNSVSSLIKNLRTALNTNSEGLYQKKYIAKFECLKYTSFRHYKTIVNFLDNK